MLLIETQKAQEILNYLVKQPYNEVVKLVEHLTTAQIKENTMSDEQNVPEVQENVTPVEPQTTPEVTPEV